MKRVDYDKYQHTVYQQARSLPAAVITMWVSTFRRYAGAQSPQSVLDLGSGTGRFTPALADEFGGPVFGVEPSERMRAIALAAATHPAVTYVDGRAERIPLPDSSCDLALLYLVMHHFTDAGAAAREITRVVRPGGTVLIRSTFADRLPDLLWYRYFPRAKELEAQIFPSVPAVQALFPGYDTVALEAIRHPFADSLPEYAERLKLRAISTLEHLTEEELTAGFARLDADAAANPGPAVIDGPSDLLVLRRR